MPRIYQLIALLLCAACCARADKRALLIGIGAYQGGSAIPNLDGPPFDVAALRTVLTTKFGFSDVRSLVDAQATRSSILREMDGLITRVKPGDYVVFYYSGHGTSYGDPASRTWGLDPNTGALLPWDVRVDQPDVNSRLLVGKRDLRPFFARLDASATVFAIFDTCYSADAAKSAATRRGSRYVRTDVVASRTRGAGIANDLDADLEEVVANQEQSPYPYRHVISLAAAGKFQAAGDITAEQVRANPSLTVDRKPHGVFSNFLLRGMSGEADKNHDGRISHNELYNYLEEASVRWSHTPVMQVPSHAMDLVSSPAFGATVSLAASLPAAGQRPIYVRTEGTPPALAARIGRLRRIALASGGSGFDLLVRRGDSGFDLFDSSGLAISRDSLTERALLARIAAQPEVEDLIGLSFKQKFNIGLRLNPSDQSVWFGGQEIQFTAQTDRAAVVLLLNIDVTGSISVVYPYGSDQPNLSAGSEQKPLGRPDAVIGPFGVEYMKLFAFETRPEDYDRWLATANEGVKTIQPGTAEFDRLMRMLRSGQDGRAETRIRIVTAPRP